MEPLPLILYIVSMATGVGFIAYRYFSSRSRTKVLENWARAHDLNFHYTQKYDADQLCAEFRCLQKGRNSYAHNVIEGAIGRWEIVAFDYYYGEQNKRFGFPDDNYSFSAVVIETNMPLKPLYIRPEKTIDKLADFAGLGDIDFESVEFSNKFYVQSPDRHWAYDVINQEVMEFMLRKPTFCLEFKGSQIIAYRNYTFTVSDFERALRLVTGIIDRISPSLVKELSKTKETS